jgi:hypothetical protein
MKIARYWTRAAGEAVDPRGGRIRVTARGWSDESIDAARICARETAGRVAQRIVTQPNAPRYPYGDRPLPEPILSEFRGGGSLSAAITRNAYGAQVMNATQMMFVDIDRQDSGGPVLNAIGKVVERQRLSARVYRTAAGHRVLISDRPFAAKTAQAEALLHEFQSDPLYVRLCRLQESFRARLTPKPWRIGFRQPPVEFPFETPADRSRFQEWEREYQSKAAAYATCAYRTSFGAGEVLPEFDALIRFHDEATKAASGLPLA